MSADARRRNQRGASAVEMAFVAPSFLLIIFAMIQFALFMHARDAALAAAREGVARLRTLPPDGDLETNRSAIEQTALYSAKQIGAVQDPHAHAVYDQAGRRVTVTVSGSSVSLVPKWTFHFDVSAHGSIEAFRPDLGTP